MEWTRVRRRERIFKPRWDAEVTRKDRVWKEDAQGSENASCSFFFTEFPDSHGAKELYNIFRDFGAVDEVVIPPKRDVRGKRYGFVRFFTVKEPERLAIKLDNIFIDGRKIHANLPKYSRAGVRRGKVVEGDGGQGLESMGVEEKTRREQGQNQKAQFFERRMTAEGNRSFAQVVANKGKKPNFAHMEFNVGEDQLARFEKSFIGVVENPGMTYNMQEYFNMEGYFSVKVTPIGANKCLLEEREEGELEFLVREAKDWLSQWFKEIRKWSPEEVDNERVTWLRCYGIPCHVWCPEFFQFLVSPVGTYMCSDDETHNLENFDVARIMVRTKYNIVLNETFNIGVNGSFFSIKIVEDS
ncbi:uncharacterized protein LOC131611080 [Vicia villosa]|uniref:uncharacterized protein LOC131611080 n=1 Tax=Vicia villosa TaxID=3911 RepID=UPI00273BC782|nr:uncharacterized protein LOC131611080 [Vicia villosa]